MLRRLAVRIAWWLYLKLDRCYRRRLAKQAIRELQKLKEMAESDKP
jgi:hypothetical protein